MPVKIFISYPREESELRNDLLLHLAPLRIAGKVECFYDEMIHPGTRWEPVILEHIKTADIVLLLICPHFFNSEYCCERELPAAMVRHKAGQAVVIPILVRPVTSWKIYDLDKLVALPKNASPVTGRNWRNRDEAWFDVVSRLQEVVENIVQHGISPEPLEAAFAGADLILEPFSRVSEDIKKAIGKADHIWLLCRTGLGLWRDFRCELDHLFIGKKKSKNNRLLVLDPQSEAFSSTHYEWIPWYVEKTQTFEEYQEKAKIFLSGLCAQSNKETIKALNIILPLMVLIVNPEGGDNRRTLMFVEYPTNGEGGKFVHGGYQEKPFLEVTPQEHRSFYQGFLESFNELWLNAKTPEPCSNSLPSG